MFWSQLACTVIYIAYCIGIIRQIPASLGHKNFFEMGISHFFLIKIHLASKTCPRNIMTETTDGAVHMVIDENIYFICDFMPPRLIYIFWLYVRGSV